MPPPACPACGIQLQTGAAINPGVEANLAVLLFAASVP